MAFSHPLARGAKVWTAKTHDGNEQRVLVIVTTIPLDPGEKGFVCMQRKLHGITDEARQARRTLLLGVGRRGISEAAHELIASSSRGFTAVIANRRSLDDAASQVPELAGRVTDLPE